MPTVAQQLRTAREAQNLSIEDVANLTKLRTDHVRALESGNYKVFSAPVYVRGFTRTYAKLLKLDPQVVLDTLSAELDQGTLKKSDEGQNNLPAKGLVDFISLYLSRINWRIALPLLILFVLIAIGSLGVRLWQYQQTRDPLADLGDGIYSSKEPHPSVYLPIPHTIRNSATNSPSQ